MTGDTLNFVFKTILAIWEDFRETIAGFLEIDEAMGESRTSQVVGLILLIVVIIFTVVRIQ